MDVTGLRRLCGGASLFNRAGSSGSENRSCAFSRWLRISPKAQTGLDAGAALLDCAARSGVPVPRARSAHAKAGSTMAF